MVVDIGVVRNYIKPKADSTLYNMRKIALIEYIRTLEHNYNVAVSFNQNQAKYIESLGFKGVVQCKDCKSHHWEQEPCHGKTVHLCSKFGAEVTRDFYCAAGERREGK